MMEKPYRFREWGFDMEMFNLLFNTSNSVCQQCTGTIYFHSSKRDVALILITILEVRNSRLNEVREFLQYLQGNEFINAIYKCTYLIPGLDGIPESTALGFHS